MFYKYPFTKQENIKDCAPASLSMIVKYYKGYTSMEKLRNLMMTDRTGTSAYNLIEAAKTLGFNAKGIKITLNDTKKIILPAIAHIIIDNSYTHFVVIYKIDYKNKKILIADPMDKIKKISFSEFEKLWTNVLIVLYPKEKLKIEKKSNFNLFIFKIFKKFKKDYFIITLFSIIIMILTIIISYYFQIMIENMYFNKLIIIFLSFSYLILIKQLIDLFRNKILIKLKNKIDFLLTTSTIKQVIELPYQYYKNRSTGDVISRINDLEDIKSFLNNIILILIEFPLAMILLIILYFTNKWFFIISFITIISYILLSIIFKRKIQNNLETYKKSKSTYMTKLVESIQGFETIKGINIENNIINKLNGEYNYLLINEKKISNLYNIESIIKQFISDISKISIIYIGILNINKTLTLGMLLTYDALISYFLEPIKNIIDLDFSYKNALHSYERIDEIFINYKKNQNIIKKGNIDINNLTFTYNDKEILKNVNLNIKQGEKIIIHGKNGSGKSTLLKLIKKYYPNDIKIDKQNYTKENILYLSQNEILFTDSLLNNLILNRNIDKQNISGAIEICHLNEVLTDLGLYMLIEENGFNLSGGEKQRIVLARSILSKFDVLLIDEALNQIDINLERDILTKLFKVYKDKTIIVVSHRYNNDDLYDRLIKVENGRIE